MNRKKISQKSPTKKIHREREPIPLRYCLLTLTCGLILVVGFFFAARQHFSSIDFGIKNSRLKKQIEELETDKRRLILAKEIAMTPSEIKKAAKKIGLTDMTASNIEVSRPTNETQGKTKVEKSDNTKPKQAFLSKTDDVKPPQKKVEKEEKKTPEVKIEKEKSLVKIAKK
ncbi:MAG: hypothetical protein ACR2MG_14790 [Pyrinomonadaceae bacterium]